MGETSRAGKIAMWLFGILASLVLIGAIGIMWFFMALSHRTPAPPPPPLLSVPQEAETLAGQFRHVPAGKPLSDDAVSILMRISSATLVSTRTSPGQIVLVASFASNQCYEYTVVQPSTPDGVRYLRLPECPQQ